MILIVAQAVLIRMILSADWFRVLDAVSPMLLRSDNCRALRRQKGYRPGSGEVALIVYFFGQIGAGRGEPRRQLFPDRLLGEFHGGSAANFPKPSQPLRPRKNALRPSPAAASIHLAERPWRAAVEVSPTGKSAIVLVVADPSGGGASWADLHFF